MTILERCVICKTLQKTQDELNGQTRPSTLASLQRKTMEKERSGMEELVLCERPL